MAVQIWTPTAQNADNSALAAAIGGAGKSLGAALARMGEEHKRNATQAKAVETFLSTLPEDKMPMDMQAFKNLSAKEKIGIGMGLLQGQQFKQEQQRTELLGSQLRDVNERISARAAEATNMARGPKFLSALSRYRQPTLETMPPGVEGPANLQPGMDFSGAAGRAADETGFQLPTAALSRLLGEMGDDAGNTGADSFIEDNITGSRFLASGKTRLPSGVNPDRITTVSVTDPNTGDLIDLPINPRSGTPLLKPKQPANPPKISEAFFKSIGEMAPGLDDPKYAARTRAGIKAVIDAAFIGKQIDQGQREEFYKAYGIGSSPAAGAGPTADPAAELALARAALKAGADRAKVATKYRERTGRELPP